MVASPPTTTRPPRLSGDFHRFWAAGTFTNLADGMAAVALPLIAATLTQDPLLVSGLMVARFLPWLLLAPLSGALIDRVHRIRAMLVSNAVATLAVVGLLVVLATGNLSIQALYATMFVLICCETVTDPASRIAVVSLVPARLLDRANGRVVGRPVAGLLFAAGAAAPLLGIAGSYALCALLLCALPLVWRRRIPEESTSTAPEGFGRSTREGFRLVFGDRLLRGNMLCNAGLMIGLNMGFAVLVLYVQEDLGVPLALFGVFTLSSALGGVVATLVVDRLILRLGRNAVVFGGYLGMAACSVGVALVSAPYTAFVLFTALGLCIVASNIAASPYHQVVVPDRVRGRVAGVSRMIGWGVTPVGALLGGLLGRVDLALPFLVGGAIVVVTALLARRIVAETALRADRGLAEAAGP